MPDDMSQNQKDMLQNPLAGVPGAIRPTPREWLWGAGLGAGVQRVGISTGETGGPVASWLPWTKAVCPCPAPRLEP